MPNVEISDKLQQQLAHSRYLVGYLAKLYHEQSNKSVTVPVTIRKEGTSAFVIDVNGHEIKFDA